MTGLVLAAGVGKRLAPLTDERPKGLLELGGRSLLARLLDGLQAAGVRETALVVGYQQEAIRAHLGTAHRGMPLRYLENPAYTRGPLLSLWTGRAEFERDDVVLADGDVLFAPPLLERWVREGRTEGDYEAALDALLDRHPFVTCPTDGLPWIEIDFPQDLHAAETEILPRIALLRQRNPGR